MMIEVIRLLRKDETGFTSVKFLAESLKDMGYPLHKKKFSTYMEYLLDLGLVEQTGIHHYPYRIVASKEKLTCVENMFIMLGQTGGMPQMVFEYKKPDSPSRYPADSICPRWWSGSPCPSLGTGARWPLRSPQANGPARSPCLSAVLRRPGDEGFCQKGGGIAQGIKI